MLKIFSMMIVLAVLALSDTVLAKNMDDACFGPEFPLVRKKMESAVDAVSFAALQQQAHKGDMAASLAIAYLYSDGCTRCGIKKDRAMRRVWFKKAAEAGNVNAESFLWIERQDPKRLSEFSKAQFTQLLDLARRGAVFPQMELATAYAHFGGSTGVARDYKKAEYWAQRLALQGCRTVAAEMARAYQQGRSGKPVRDARIQAYKWFLVAHQPEYAKHYDAILARLAKLMSKKDIRHAQKLARRIIKKRDLK